MILWAIVIGGMMALFGVCVGFDLGRSAMQKQIRAEIRRYVRDNEKVSMAEVLKIVMGK